METMPWRPGCSMSIELENGGGFPRKEALEGLVWRLRQLERQPWRAEHVESLLRRPVPFEAVRPYLLWAPRRYARSLVYRSEAFEVLLLCWDRGARSPVHGHDGQQCWFTPVAGAFEVTDFHLLEGGREPGYARVTPTRREGRVVAGTLDRRTPDEDLHPGLGAVFKALVARLGRKWVAGWIRRPGFGALSPG